MKPEGESRWLWVLATLPLCGILGYVCGYYVSLGIPHLHGKGNSHNDMFTIVFSAILGAGVGSLLFPVLTWLFTRNRRK